MYFDAYIHHDIYINISKMVLENLVLAKSNNSASRWLQDFIVDVICMVWIVVISLVWNVALLITPWLISFFEPGQRYHKNI